jgi:hypothetical protein
MSTILKDKVLKYKFNSPPVFFKNEPVFVTGIVRQNRPLINFLEENNNPKFEPFNEALVEISSILMADLPTLIPGFRVGFASSNFFVLYFKLDSDIERDNLNSIFCSRATNLVATALYKNPMFLVTSFPVLQKDVKSVFRYYKKAWLAKRNRLIGEKVLGIKESDKSLEHSKVLELSLEKGFNLDSLPLFLKEGLSIGSTM